jgi:hypothetical protein
MGARGVARRGSLALALGVGLGWSIGLACLRCRLDFARISACFGFDWLLAQRCLGGRGGRGHDLAVGVGVRQGQRVRRARLVGRLGLERLERAQRAPQLGHGGTPVAQQRVERARAIAVAHQGKAEPAPAALAALGLQGEQLALDPIGALEPPGGDHQAPRQQGLQRADRREIVRQRVGHGLERTGVLVVQQDELFGAQAVLERVLGGARLALRRFGPARLGAIAPARFGARGRKGDVHGVFLGCAARSPDDRPATSVYCTIGINARRPRACDQRVPH